jgi:hypothetical protein
MRVPPPPPEAAGVAGAWLEGAAAGAFAPCEAPLPPPPPHADSKIAIATADTARSEARL